MKSKNHIKAILSIIIAIFFISLGAISIFVVQSETGSDDTIIIGFTNNKHVTPAIWGYSQSLTKPAKAGVLTINQNQWEALTAVCAVPAFFGRAHSVPLFFSDGSGDVSTVIPYESKAINSYGSDASTAAAEIAKNYWSKAEIVFGISTYEQALWLVPSASFLGAPILVSPSKDTLSALGTKTVISIGDTAVEAESVITLSSKEDVWSFQLELFDTKGEVCNYVILTNPHDTDDSKPANIEWRYQSPTSALLGAYHHGIIQTGDWSVDRAAFEEVETATDPDEANYNKIKPRFTELKADSYAVEKFLQDHGHTPKFLAAVGGPYAVPNFVYDIHVDYYFPTPPKNHQKTQYPSSLAAYATLAQTVDEKKYTEEDLAAGRLAAGNIFDLSKQLMKSFFYREFLPNGKYSSDMPSGWEKKACFIDGHRLNQPEPNGLYWDRNVEYYPYNDVNPSLEDAGLTTTYYLPRNESDPFDTNLTIDSYIEKTTEFGYFHFMPHGGMTSLRIEVGVDNLTGRQNHFLEATTIKELNYKAPTLVYATCCKGGVWMHDEGYEPSDFITSAFIHAGAVAYIATPEIQAGCFWKQAPYAVSGDQAIEFWDNVVTGNIPIGEAWRDAKWKGHTIWENKAPKPESPLTHHVDCISYTLFGDPALEISKPKIPFETDREIDINVEISEIKPGKDFTVTVTPTDLKTSAPIPDAVVKITYNGNESAGTTATFTAPKQAGEFTFTVNVAKSGYNTIDTDIWFEIGSEGKDDGKKEEDGGGFLPGFEIYIIVLSIVTMLVICKSKSRKHI